MAQMYPYLFTVFTPTYNRKSTLPRVYESLKAQTLRSFEWLIVDDGSTDDTAALIEIWDKEAHFPIRYIYQENRGKHFAHNRAVCEAQGEFFITLDSDDACVAEALERLDFHWNSIPIEIRGKFSAVTVLCKDQNGKLVGDRFPYNIIDSDPLEMYYKFKIRGEKWGFQRTSVVRQFLFSESIQQQYVPEGLIWNRIGSLYKVRYVNELLRIYYIGHPSLTDKQSWKKNIVGRHIYHNAVLNEHIHYFWVDPISFFRSIIIYVLCSLYLGISFSQQLNGLTTVGAKILWGLVLPLSVSVYWFDNIKAHFST